MKNRQTRRRDARNKRKSRTKKTSTPREKKKIPQFLDPIDLYKYKLKNKLSIDISEDLLTEDADIIPRNQKHFVFGSIEPDPDKYELQVIYDFDMFIRQMREYSKKHKKKSILQKYFEDPAYDSDFLMRYFKMFKQRNYEKLSHGFNDKYPNYGGCKMFKFFGAFGSIEAANKRANTVLSRDDKYYIGRGLSGFWTEFNPPLESVNEDNIVYREQKMQDLMSQHLKNNIKISEDFKKRRKIILEKELRDAKKTDLKSSSITNIVSEDVVNKDSGQHERVYEKGLLISDEELNREFERYNMENETSLDIAMGEDEKNDKLAKTKEMLITEIMAGETSVNPEILTKLNMDQKYIDILNQNIKNKQDNMKQDNEDNVNIKKIEVDMKQDNEDNANIRKIEVNMKQDNANIKKIGKANKMKKKKKTKKRINKNPKIKRKKIIKRNRSTIKKK
jgi:hypothetical protein